MFEESASYNSKKSESVNKFLSLAENPDRIKQMKIVVSDIVRWKKVFVLRKFENKQKYTTAFPKQFLKKYF